MNRTWGTSRIRSGLRCECLSAREAVYELSAWFLAVCSLCLVSSSPARATQPAARSVDGLAALYMLDMGVGFKRPVEWDAGILRDTSGHTEPLDLRIDKPQTILFRPGCLDLASAVTIAADGPATRLIQAAKATNELTVETWLKPQTLEQSGPARIVTLSIDTGQRNFTLSQDGGRFDMRLRTTDRDVNGMPSLATQDQVVANRLTHVVFTRHRGGQARIYVDGKLLIDQVISGTLANWSDDYRLAIGNEITGDRPWLGELYLVAIYTRGLSADEVAGNYRAGAPRAVNYANHLPPAASRQVDFAADVQPLFRKHCFECHSEDNEDGGLNLGIRARAIEGGDHGPIFVPGNSAESRLIHYVAAVDQATVMPPGSSGLSREEVGILRAWIDQGARWQPGLDIPDPRFEKARSHFAFQPLRAVPEPEVRASDWPRTGIDRFILARLESTGIPPASRAGAATLIRRLSFDLTGLPPAACDVQEFQSAAAVDFDKALQALVDRLLASSHYGERWGRHWLDVARYADSDGQESDRDRPNAYHYRDFVIRSLNDDMPYDQFIRWQLAGDEYRPDDPMAVAAVGFLSSGPFAALPDRLMEDERLRNRYNELDDIVSTVGSGLLGLTLGCVRCHDHKYDAIPARDYYSLLSAFHGGERGDVEVGPDKTKVFTYRDLTAQPQPTWLFQRGNYYDRDQLVSLGFVSIMTGQKSPQDYWQQARGDLPSNRSTGQRRALAEWMTDIDQGAGRLLARVIVNRVWMHHFGQGIVRTPGDFGVRAEPPTHPELLDWLAYDFVTSGWRLKRLQRLIVTSAVYLQSSQAPAQVDDPDNRLLWRMPLTRLEGEALRDAMLSASGTLNIEPYGPGVKPPVAAEAMLARNLKDAYPAKIKDGPEQRRRSIYLFHKRVVPYPLLQAFDKPDAQQSCTRRDRTTVAPQALALLNDPMVRTIASDFARRLMDANVEAENTVAKNDDSTGSGGGLLEAAAIDQWVVDGYWHALSRAPTEDERQWAVRFITQQTEQRTGRAADADVQRAQMQAVTDFCQVLFSLNEFVYVD